MYAVCHVYYKEVSKLPVAKRTMIYDFIILIYFINCRI